jgi:mRNA-degrading endonuclease YafQ of YafQ-DinJ toxin-antitoxin module
MTTDDNEFGLHFEDDMHIDPDQLDIAALEQTNLAVQYSRAAAHYDRVAKKAHERVKTLRSQLVRDVTEDPEKLLGKGIKATASTIEAYYRGDSEYQQAKQDMITAEYNRDLAKSAADHIAFQRKKMIEVLAQLLQQEYFAAPSVPRNLSTEWRDRKKQRIEAATAAATPRRTRRA